MMKHLKRFVAITISMVMAFQFCTNDFYLYAETEPADPGQTQVTNEPESGPSDSTEEAAEETPSSDTGTPEPSAPVEEQPAAPVEEQPVAPVEEQLEVASILKVEFVDANNASVKETVEQALESKYVGKTINLDELGIDINVEGYTLTEVKDKNDNTQVYTTETKDFVLTGNITELQFVYTQNVQTDQPEKSEDGQKEENEKKNTEDKANKVASNLLNVDPTTDKKIQVLFVDENGTAIQGAPTEVSTGICANIAGSSEITNNQALQGYDYVKTTVDNDEIYSVGSVGNIFYYVPIDDQNTGLLLEEKQVVFHYEKHVETYKIEYDTTLEKDGPNEVKAGKSYSFTVKPSGKGQKLVVIVNGQDISNTGVIVNGSTGLTRYTVENVSADQSVAITESQVENYVFSYNNERIRQGNIIKPETNTDISAGENFSFELISDTGGRVGTNEWHLNLLAINGEYVNVPTSFNIGDSSDSVLSTGEQVKITLLENRYNCDWGYPRDRCYRYQVEISNVYTDITVTDGNFKNADRQEIILKRLDGVSKIIG